MALIHATDTVFAVKGGNASFTLEVQAGFPARGIARKKIFPIPEQRFTAYVSPQPPTYLASGNYHLTVEMVPGEVSIFGEWENDEQHRLYILNGQDDEQHRLYILNGQDEYAPKNLLTIACIKEPAEPPIGFTDFRVEPGGTYAYFFGRPQTRAGKQYFVRLWVDKDPANLNGTKRVFRTLKREDPF